MEGNYEVHFDGESVGQVQVIRQGLYYRFLCNCHLSGDSVCKLVVTTDNGSHSLGIPVPKGREFCLETTLAAKHLGTGKPSFQLQPNRAVLVGKFVPISPEEPFAYLSRLKDAYLARWEGKLGVVIKENAGT